MNPVLLLLKPRLQAAGNALKKANRQDRRFRLLMMSGFGLLFWAGIFTIFYRVISYFKRVEGFGDVLALKLLSMVLISFFAILILSGIIVIVAKLYLSRDLPLVHALPISPGKIFLSRWLESLFDSSWMVALYSLPIFLSYGLVYQAGVSFYLAAGVTLVTLSLAAAGISAILVLVAAILLPAHRLRSMVIFLGAVLVILLVLAFRLMRPEQLVDPEAFVSLAQYLKTMEASDYFFLPTTWAHDLLKATLLGGQGTPLNLALLVSFSGSLVFCLYWLSEAVYFSGYSLAQNAQARFIFLPRRAEGGLGRFFSGPVRALILKETRVFRRDQTQWPQLFLILALIVIYVYNFSVLPLGSMPWRATYLKNLVSFLNIGLAAFVLTALAARFVYPAVSTEGEAFWLIQAAPIRIRTFLLVKFFVYAVPFLILSELLIVLTNIILEVTPFMMALSTLTMLLLVPGIVSLALGLGAAYPNFHAENPAQSVTSMGGLIFMILSAGVVLLVVVLEAGPAYRFFLADLTGKGLSGANWGWIGLSLMLVLIISALAVVLPLRYGEKRLLKKVREE
ncbi:MAG: hypothetical protein U1C55_06340 [Smithellaceae bacterium]|nr:hypothetical protein [Smithellaceae bacterium]